MNHEQYKIVAHSLGVDTRKMKLPKDFYRNRFVAGDGHHDELTLNSLKNTGMMDCTENQEILNGSRYWWVTDIGILEFIRQHKKRFHPFSKRLKKGVPSAV